ncbi:hypothetical protein MUK42_07294 [Musa troglodytarum]|uniref:Uncharacterized protein n=1 Tax=Musa troglodytarum TaxID=320322 RepID=A0A9E7L2F1_9LILI|nr:hypothetical protein MUK42_07294 [Musa troglodytarum]
MGAEVVVMGELPLVPPIKTAPIRDKPAEGRRPEVGSTDDHDCVTPKSEEHVLKPLLVCPPAPKKPKPARRAPAAPSREFCAVPRDLTSVFLSLPPKKRLREFYKLKIEDQVKRKRFLSTVDGTYSLWCQMKGGQSPVI